MDELLVLFGYPCGSAAALLSGVLPLRYCSGRFACRVPAWSLPAHGHVHEIAGDVVVSRNEQVGRAQLPGQVRSSRVLCGWRILGGVERVRLNRKTPALSVSAKGLEEAHGPLDRVGVGRRGLGMEFGDARAHVFRFCMNRGRN